MQSEIIVKRSSRKTKIMEVIKTKMNKTIVARELRRVKHPVYGKMIKKTKNYLVHDPQNKSKVGDIVEIMETRPLSKLKRWRLVDIKTKFESN